MRIYLLIALFALVTSCVRNNNQTSNGSSDAGRSFEVSEVIQATAYTYLRVSEKSEEKWMAVNKQDIKPGEVLYYDEALQMTNFHSKDLDRTFEVIYFVNNISHMPIFNHPAAVMPGTGNMGSANENPHSGKVEPGKKNSIDLNKKTDEFTIASIFENPKELSGKEIEIRGIVVKVNREIMGRNWIHIQDGTDYKGKYDLTVTTNALAETGDEVVFKGKIAVDKDFGSGYFYEILMEEAVIVQQ